MSKNFKKTNILTEQKDKPEMGRKIFAKHRPNIRD